MAYLLQNILFVTFLEYIKSEFLNYGDPKIFLKGQNLNSSDPRSTSYQNLPNLDYIFECDQKIINLKTNDKGDILSFRVPNCTEVNLVDWHSGMTSVITTYQDIKDYWSNTFQGDVPSNFLIMGLQTSNKILNSDLVTIWGLRLVNLYQIKFVEENPIYSQQFLTTLNLIMIYVSKYQKSQSDSDQLNLQNQLKDLNKIYGSHYLTQISFGGQIETQTSVPKCEFNNREIAEMKVGLQLSYNGREQINDVLKFVNLCYNDPLCNQQLANLDLNSVADYQKRFKTSNWTYDGGDNSIINQWENTLQTEPIIITYETKNLTNVFQLILKQCNNLNKTAKLLQNQCENWSNLVGGIGNMDELFKLLISEFDSFLLMGDKISELTEQNFDSSSNNCSQQSASMNNTTNSNQSNPTIIVVVIVVIVVIVILIIIVAQCYRRAQQFDRKIIYIDDENIDYHLQIVDRAGNPIPQLFLEIVNNAGVKDKNSYLNSIYRDGKFEEDIRDQNGFIIEQTRQLFDRAGNLYFNQKYQINQSRKTFPYDRVILYRGGNAVQEMGQIFDREQKPVAYELQLLNQYGDPIPYDIQKLQNAGTPVQHRGPIFDSNGMPINDNIELFDRFNHLIPIIM